MTAVLARHLNSMHSESERACNRASLGVSFQHRRVESVAFVAPGEAPLLFHQSKLRMGGQKPADHILVLLAFEGAGGIKKPAILAEHLCAAEQDLLLAFGKAGQIAGFETPFNFGISGQSSGSRTGCVDEDAVERAGER